MKKLIYNFQKITSLTIIYFINHTINLLLILISYENIGYELQDVKLVEAHKCTPAFSL